MGASRFGGDEGAYVADSRDTEEWALFPSPVAFMDLEGAVPEAELREVMARRAAGWEPPAGPFVAVSAGDGFTCGLRLGGEVACWGYFAREEPRIPLDVYADVYGERHRARSPPHPSPRPRRPRSQRTADDPPYKTEDAPPQAVRRRPRHPVGWSRW